MNILFEIDERSCKSKDHSQVLLQHEETCNISVILLIFFHAR